GTGDEFSRILADLFPALQKLSIDLLSVYRANRVTFSLDSFVKLASLWELKELRLFADVQICLNTLGQQQELNQLPQLASVKNLELRGLHLIDLDRDGDNFCRIFSIMFSNV